MLIVEMRYDLRTLLRIRFSLLLPIVICRTLLVYEAP